MSLCARCDCINLDDGCLYALSDPALMVDSAGKGCLGCKFFLNSARQRGHNFEEAGMQVLLRRLGKGDNRVDLCFLGSQDGNLTLRGAVPLRLCSAYGMEPAFSAEYEGADEVFLGRLISPSSADDECLDLAAGWSERCSRQHGHFCRPQADVALPARLVHIPRNSDQKLQLCITEGLKGRYVALSYCWGNGAIFCTTKATLDARKAGFDVSLLPKSLQDAIQIARRLGFEWIWIDSLCIIQGDLDDWSCESSKMAEVYGNSSLTLCADLAYNTGEGILKPRKTLRSHQFGSNAELCLQTRGEGWQRMEFHALYRRGWAFQERLLSSRILHFLEEQLAWECNTTLYLEEFRGRQTNPEGHFAKNMFSRYLNFPLTIDVETSKNLPQPQGHEADLIERIGAWNAVIQEMSVRLFSISSDKLPSVSGVASAIEVPPLGKYIAGVWEHNPFLSMGWFPRYSQVPSHSYRAPSWSWVSTEHQLIWFYDTWATDTSCDARDDWNLWVSLFAPKLLDHCIILKSMDPKGEVKEGSHLVMSGSCREIYIIEQPEKTFYEWEFIRDGSGIPGRKVHMDVRKHNRDSISYFPEDLVNLDAGVDSTRLKKYTCVQIARERRHSCPKILALILECIDKIEGAFRRVGLLAFDPPGDHLAAAKWNTRTLKLF